MKIRKGFVSNSSTTSFTCDACGEIIAYHDSCDYNDLGITQFPCGHGVCSCTEDTEECPVCSLESINNDYIFEYVIVKFQLNLEEVQEEIKSNFKDFAEFKNWINEQRKSIK